MINAIIEFSARNKIIVRTAGRNLIVDTGAYPSVIDKQTAHQLGLSSDPREVHVLDRNLKGGEALLPTVEIGPLRVRNLKVIVEDLTTLSMQTGLRVDGLIGMDVLAHMNFRIDYVAQTIMFGAPVQLAHSAPIEWRASMACVEMSVDGHPVHLLIDSGGAKTVLFAQHLPWAREPLGKSFGFANPGGHVTLRKVAAREVSLGQELVAPEEIYVSDATNMAPYPFDGLLTTLSPHFSQVAFDFEHNIFSWNSDYVAKVKTRQQKRSTMTASVSPEHGAAGGGVSASSFTDSTASGGDGITPSQ